jgi:eukaryotic-like serine/threonine-protein kinase
MTPARWHEITGIFRAALARDPASRDAFLHEACRHDQSLRPEIEALVAAHDNAGSFGDRPMLDVSRDEPRLQPGTRVGPFRIDGLIGVGGMGEVYRATDTNLGRAVAIKVLPDAVAADPERLARLAREARVLAALNHPNIAAIYGLEQAEGLRALILELVEGQTLAQTLEGRALPISEALVIARQIAEALEAAHEKGIVHRDLKPANVALTRERVVKVLDFGLAKAVSGENSDAVQATIAANATGEGMIVGTAAYMSPEQARGLPVDKRTDIWAFGCVLYELIAGRPAFGGATPADTLAAILEREPDWIALPAATPAHVRRLLRRALQKDAALRLRDIGDARIELLTGEDAQPAPYVQQRSLRRPAYLTGAAVLAVAVGAFLVGWKSGAARQGSAATATAPSFRQLTFRRGSIQMARFAADGKTILYSAAWDGHPYELFVGSIDAPEARSLGWPGGALFAVSRENDVAVLLGCAFDMMFGNCRGTLATASLGGGAPRALANDVRFADWGLNNELAVVRKRAGGDRLEYPVGRVLHEGGYLVFPRVDSQGRRVAVVSAPVGSEAILQRIPDVGTAARVSLLVIDSDGTRRTLSSAWPWVTGVAWSPAGNELWFSALRGQVGTLHAVTLDGRERPVMRMPGSLRLHDVSADGSVLLTQMAPRVVTMVKTANEEFERPYSWFDAGIVAELSPDGRWLLFTEGGEAVDGRQTMYLRPTDGTSPPIRLGEGIALALSPDAAWVLSLRSGPPQQQLMLVPAGAGEPVVLPRGSIEAYEQNYASFFPDGRRVLFHARQRGEGLRVFTQELPAGDPQPITPVLADITYGVISPDGQWVVASIAEAGGVRHMLYPAAGGAPRQIRGSRPNEPPIQWSADGSELYVRTWNPGSRESESKIFRLSLRTGVRTLWRTLRVTDSAGATAPMGIMVTPDGRSYAYNYRQLLHELYLGTGLK